MTSETPAMPFGARPTEPKTGSVLTSIIQITGLMVGVFALLDYFLPLPGLQIVGALIAGFVLTLVLINTKRVETTLAYTIWGEAALLLLVLFLVVSRPTTIVGWVVQEEGTPMAGLALDLIDAGGVSHRAVTDEEGYFEVRNVPEGRYTLSSADQFMLSGEIPSGWQRLIAPPRVPVVALPYHAAATATPMPSPTAIAPADTPLPITETPTLQATACPEGTLCELFPQVGGTGAAIFQYESRPEDLDDRFLPQCARSGEFGLSLRYSLTSADIAGWGIHWADSPAGRINLSGYSVLELWVKGEAGGEIFDMGLKDTGQNEVKVRSSNYTVVSGADWTLFRIPLADFTDINLESIENVNFGFNERHGMGAFCVDDFAFVP